jgi:uncharacterized membrane protein YqhA
VAIYELFIGDLTLTDWLVIHNLDELKSKLVSVIVLVIGLTFLEKFIEWHDPSAILQNGLAGALIVGVLILFVRYSGKHD